MNWPFGSLRMFGYDIIYADPPWGSANWSEAGEGRNPNQHYPTMTADEIIAMPVGELASGNCAMFLWCVDPLLDRGFDALRAWGFRYVTKAFTWAKLNPSGEGFHLGTGYYTRANDETCLLGIIGNMKRLDAGVRQLVVEPVREHSRKPDRIRDDIVRLFGDRPRCELFARTSAQGWDAWGNETRKFSEPAVASAALLL
jgi:N6-adenosine-specific RNA methylase IME4